MARKHYLFILLSLGLLALPLMGSTPQKPYAVPPGSTINEAWVGLYVVEGDVDDTCIPVWVCKVEEPWDEDAIDWGNQPDFDCGGPPEPGFDCIDLDLPTWWYWDVTEIVQSWVDCTNENYGFAFLNQDPAYGIALGRCGEFPSDLTPELYIRYNDTEEVTIKLDCDKGQVATIDSFGGGYPRETVSFGWPDAEERGFVRFPGIKEPPFVPEASTMILFGSGLAGLAGYASLRLRARRKREE